jgi:hypothetical protein
MSYHLPRVSTTQLAAGLRTVLTEFENAARIHSWKGSYPPEEREMIEKRYQSKKQAMLRKLIRIQNGPNEGHVEQMKRDFRKLAKAYVMFAGNGDARALFPDEWRIADDLTRNMRAL